MSAKKSFAGETSCNMPVTEDLKVLTDTELVRAHRKSILQFLTLNHPVDCGICDKAGECTLQDYHYEYSGQRSLSHDEKVRSTKFYNLSNRILLDSMDGSRFVTAFYGLLEPRTGAIGFANCGHNPPLLIRADGGVECHHGDRVGMNRDGVHVDRGDDRVDRNGRMMGEIIINFYAVDIG